MQCDPAHDLDIEVALAGGALGCLAHRGEGLGEEIVRRLPVLQAQLELPRLGLEFVVGQLLHLRLVGGHELCHGVEVLELAAFAQVREFVQYQGEQALSGG